MSRCEPRHHQLFLDLLQPKRCHELGDRIGAHLNDLADSVDAILLAPRDCRLELVGDVAAIEQLREEASKPDFTPIPIQRRVFTETAPIPGFQDKVASLDKVGATK